MHHPRNVRIGLTDYGPFDILTNLRADAGRLRLKPVGWSHTATINCISRWVRVLGRKTHSSHFPSGRKFSASGISHDSRIARPFRAIRNLLFPHFPLRKLTWKRKILNLNSGKMPTRWLLTKTKMIRVGICVALSLHAGED